MKKILLLLITFFSLSMGYGQTTDLFISEYVEGSGSNKVIEVYNGTGVPVNLSTYTLRGYQNGAATVGYTVTLTGTLADGEVLIVKNASAAGACDATGDITITFGLSFNGNDVVALAKSGVNIDVIGTIGSSTTFAANTTLSRKSTICSPVMTYDSGEWDALASNTCSGLGSHTANCVAGCTISNVTTTQVSCSGTMATVNVTFEYANEGADFSISGNNGFTTLTGQAYTGSPQTVPVMVSTPVTGQTFTITDADNTCNDISTAMDFDCPQADQLEYTSVSTTVSTAPFDLEVCATNGTDTQTDYSTGITLTQTTGTAVTSITPASPATPTNGCVTFTITPSTAGETISFDATSGALPTEATGNITVNAGPPACGDAGGLLVNEFTNGTSGSPEYIELVVLGAPGNPTAPVDMTGWIIDDNNGDFGSSGVAPGHIRLSSAFSNMTPGDIIVIYNNLDVNPEITALGDDPTDSNNDGVYVLPANHASIETTTNASTPYTYSSGVNGAWNNVSFRNGGDVASTRCPINADDELELFHALTWGDNAPNGQANAVSTGGGNGAGDVYFFNCSGMYSSAAYTLENAAPATETPGEVNNSDNGDLIQAIIDGTIDYDALRSNSDLTCSETLPIDLVSFTANKDNNTTMLNWETATEENNDYFEIQRSVDGVNFSAIGTVKGNGTTIIINSYDFVDVSPMNGMNYYRLMQYDYDGTTSVSDVKTVEFNDANKMTVYPNPVQDELFVNIYAEKETSAIYTITSTVGQVVSVKQVVINRDNNQLKINTNNFPTGTYFFSLELANGKTFVERVVKF